MKRIIILAVTTLLGWAGTYLSIQYGEPALAAISTGGLATLLAIEYLEEDKIKSLVKTMKAVHVNPQEAQYLKDWVLAQPRIHHKIGLEACRRVIKENSI